MYKLNGGYLEGKVWLMVLKPYLFHLSSKLFFFGGLHLKPKKFEKIFVAVITFFLFLCANNCYLAYCLLCVL